MDEDAPNGSALRARAATWPQIGAFSTGWGRGMVEDMARAFRDAGLSAVQLSDELLAEAVDDPTKIPAMRDALDAHGVKVVALAGYRNLVAPDADIRQANLDFLKRCLEIAPQLGTPIVATETGTRNRESDWLAAPENSTGHAWELLYEAIEELLPVAEAHGAILALEGFVNNVLRTHEQLAGLLEQLPSPHLQVVLDPYNYLSKALLPERERIALEFFERFEPWFVVAHLKDVSPQGAEVDTPEFGTGVFPQLQYLRYLKHRRPDLPLVLEHLPFDHIPAAIKRIHAFLDVAE